MDGFGIHIHNFFHPTDSFSRNRTSGITVDLEIFIVTKFSPITFNNEN